MTEALPWLARLSGWEPTVGYSRTVMFYSNNHCVDDDRNRKTRTQTDRTRQKRRACSTAAKAQPASQRCLVGESGRSGLALWPPWPVLSLFFVFFLHIPCFGRSDLALWPLWPVLFYSPFFLCFFFVLVVLFLFSYHGRSDLALVPLWLLFSCEPFRTQLSVAPASTTWR